MRPLGYYLWVTLLHMYGALCSELHVERRFSLYGVLSRESCLLGPDAGWACRGRG